MCLGHCTCLITECTKTFAEVHIFWLLMWTKLPGSYVCNCLVCLTRAIPTATEILCYAILWWICCAHQVYVYFWRPTPGYGPQSQLVFDYNGPFKPASTDYIPYWLKSTLATAGFPQQYTAHSTRSACTSAVAHHLSIEVFEKYCPNGTCMTEGLFILCNCKPVDTEITFLATCNLKSLYDVLLTCIFNRCRG